MIERGASESLESDDLTRDGAGQRAATPAAEDELPFGFPSILAIADALPVMVAYCDRGEVYRFCNRPIAEWFERPRSEILGRTVREIMGEAAYALRAEQIRAALAGEPQRYCAEFAHPTRGALVTRAEYIPHQAADGLVAGVIMIVQDVTEQRAAEAAIRDSEERFRRIANSAPAPIWVTRADRSRDFINDSYAAFLGLSGEKARKADWRERLHPDDHDRIVAESLAGEASGEPFTLEARYRRADGEYRWLRSVSQPRRDKQGNIVGFIGVASDITPAKEAEQELRQLVLDRTGELMASEARFRAIFDAVREIIVLTDPKGTIIQMNRTPARWRDSHPEKALGRKLWDAPTMLAYPQHRALMKGAVATAARGEIFQREVVMEREGMATAYLDVSIRPVLDHSGTVTYLLFEARDISDLKIAQDQLRQAQKMEALGQLTGGIAHDFNNLLTVIVGGLDILAKRVEEPRLARYAANALSAAERGARLTNQLLAFSRVQRLEVRPTVVGPVIEELEPLLRNVLGPGIEMRFELAGALPAVMADATQIEVAAINVAINARDAMPEGGTLTLSARMVTIDDDPELQPGGYLKLAIADTGLGMEPDVAARAFEPFFTTKEVGKGTGLGLSMVYGMARQSGGTARIASIPGEGCTISLFFREAERATQLPEERPVSAPAVEHPPETLSVLVIDDDPDVRGFIVASLDELGYQVSAAMDGPAGLDAFAVDRPDFVIIDFVMPGMTGAEVATRILAEVPDQKLLFVSGYSETDAIRGAAPGAALLTKPFRPEALHEALSELLNGTS